MPLVAPLKLNVPRVSSAPLTKLLRVEKVIPVVVGAAGVPVPSVQPSFCIHESLNCPAAEGLKMALFGGTAVSWSVTDWIVHRPMPNWLSKELFAADRLNCSTL